MLRAPDAAPVQPAVPVAAPITQPNDPLQAHHPAVVQFLRGHELGVVAEIAQENQRSFHRAGS